MKNNKNLFIVLFLPFFLFSQKKYKYTYEDGNNFLKMAKESIQKNDMRTAKTLIQKAKKANYGFCGNSWVSADSKIKLMEAEIFNKKKRYEKSLTILESIDRCSYGADCSTRDFLKIETLILKFGKERVKKAFSSVDKISKLDINDPYETYTVLLKDLDYTFNFTLNDFILLDNQGNEIKHPITDNVFQNIAQNQEFYSLIE